MEKHELFEKLAPYLPYGVRFQEYYTQEISTLIGLTTSKSTAEKFRGTPSINMFFDNGTAITYNEHYQLANRPILRPLSGLTCKEVREFLDITRVDTIRSFRRAFQEKPLEQAYFVTRWLIENHFDVFGLIGKGLAVDINTLK